VIAEGAADEPLGPDGAGCFGLRDPAAQGRHLEKRHFLQRGLPPHGRDIIVAILGWLLASYGAMVLAVLFWRCSKRMRFGWLLHPLFPVAAFLSYWAGGSIMLGAIGASDFDSTIGGPVIVGGLLLPISMLGYLVAVISFYVSRWRKRAVRGPKPLDDIFS
jgi:hypothetical protein